MWLAADGDRRLPADPKLAAGFACDKRGLRRAARRRHRRRGAAHPRGAGGGLRESRAGGDAPRHADGLRRVRASIPPRWPRAAPSPSPARGTAAIRAERAHAGRERLATRRGRSMPARAATPSRPSIRSKAASPSTVPLESGRLAPTLLPECRASRRTECRRRDLPAEMPAADQPGRALADAQYRRNRPTSRPWMRTRSGPKMRVS